MGAANLCVAGVRVRLVRVTVSHLCTKRPMIDVDVGVNEIGRVKSSSERTHSKLPTRAFRLWRVCVLGLRSSVSKMAVTKHSRQRGVSRKFLSKGGLAKDRLL